MKSQHLLVCIIGLAAFSGVADGFYVLNGTAPPIQLKAVFTSTLFAAIYVWYYTDANERGYSRNGILAVPLVLIAPIFVPIYLYLSLIRGERAKAILKFIGFFIVLCAVSMLARLPFAVVANGG